MSAPTAALPRVVIVGRPNVGKSSLFNRLVGQERAIVHPEPGTTRDAVDTVVEVNGKRYRLVDTAGIRRRAKTHGLEIPSAGRTRSALARSDVAVLIAAVARARSPTWRSSLRGAASRVRRRRR